MLTGGLTVAKTVAKRSGENATSDFVTNLAFGAYNKAFAPNRTAVDWLSADEDNVDRYIADPMCGQPATVGLFRQMLTGIRFNQKAENLRKMDKDMPVLFISGEQDPVGNMMKGVIRGDVDVLAQQVALQLQYIVVGHDFVDVVFCRIQTGAFLNLHHQHGNGVCSYRFFILASAVFRRAGR